jgi:2-dehydro-3-deoxygluconokinase
MHATPSASHLRPWRHHSVLGIGEAMIEFASVASPGGDNCRRGFAGDTLNTCWHMAQLLGASASVGYCTRIGTDPFSDQLAAFIASSGMDTTRIARDPERTLGLYVISLTGAERHFSYWRDASAARRLADDPAVLAEAVRGVGLVHVSGITLAVIGETGRRHLIDALRQARRDGTVVSFDPNVRMRLWRDAAQAREAVQAMLAVVDIALPSFDDEAALWGDTDPAATRARLAQAGVAEVVVKDGGRDVAYAVAGERSVVPTPAIPVTDLKDTTGAGDAFNAGYLTGRLAGLDAQEACRLGQRVAGIVIRHYGALAPVEALAGVRDSVAEGLSRSAPAVSS